MNRSAFFACIMIASTLLFSLPNVFAINDLSSSAFEQPQNSCPSEVPLGRLFECSIGTIGSANSYGITVSINDKLVVRLARTTSTLDPVVKVYDQGNNEVCGNSAISSIVVFECPITSSGNFTIEVRDNGQDETGSYQMYVQNLANVGNASTIAYGQVYPDSITSGIESKTYTFTAEANDKIIVRFVRISGSITFAAAVYDKNGRRICDNSAAYPTISIEDCTIGEAGIHTVFISDNGYNGTGTYSFHFQKFNAAANSPNIAFGVSTVNEIASVGEIDTFSFTATVNDQLTIRFARTDGSLGPVVAVYNQVGTEVCGNSAVNEILVIDCSITVSGLHTLFIDDASVNSTGAYRVITQRLNNPENTTSISFGQTINETIDTIVALDTYIFNAASGNILRLNTSRSSGSLSPRIRIYDPNGKLLCSNGVSGSSVQISSCAIVTSGRHTILVEDNAYQNTGNYTMTLTCLSAQCGLSQPLTNKLFLPLLKR